MVTEGKGQGYLRAMFSWWQFRSRHKGRSVSFKKYVDMIMYEQDCLLDMMVRKSVCGGGALGGTVGKSVCRGGASGVQLLKVFVGKEHQGYSWEKCSWGRSIRGTVGKSVCGEGASGGTVGKSVCGGGVSGGTVRKSVCGGGVSGATVRKSVCGRGASGG